MDDESREIYKTGVQVCDFGVVNAADFPKGSRSEVNFKLIAAKIPIIEASGALQESNIGEQATAIKELAYVALLNYMRKINKTVRGLSIDYPDLMELFRMPHGSSYQKALAAGMAYHANSAAYEELMCNDGGLPEDFRAVLLAKITNLETATTKRNTAKGKEVGATASIATEIKTVFDAIMRLRGTVPNVYENNPAKLAEWESASHIQQPPKRTIRDEKK